MSGNWWRQDLTTPTPTGGRAELVAGMLGTRLDSASLTTLGCEKGWEEQWDIPWTVGLVTGESGTGKTSLIRDSWPGAITPAHLEWPADVAVVDLFPPSLPVGMVTRLLAGAGLSTVPAWLRPARALSTGQRFRVTLARLLALAVAEPGRPVVVDEFATGVDLATARAASVGAARLARELAVRLVAVTAREELEEWLNPDWVARPRVLAGPDDRPATFQRRCLRRRPAITLHLGRCHRTSWDLFRSHHYLTGSLAPAAICLGAWVTGQPTIQVGFSAWVKALGKPGFREHRTVVSPPWQGLGVGTALSDWCASLLAGLGQAVWSTTGHPALLASRYRSANWSMTRPPGLVNPERGRHHATCRMTAGFRYTGPVLDAARARAVLGRWGKSPG